ncbi:MAG: type II toxin-antitoxin system RelE/ParE family toxin [Geminicoccaceae bacterium]
MRIRNVLHRGLRRLVENDDPTGVQPAVVEKVRRIVSFLQDMAREEELRSVPSWKAHRLTGDRRGTWSLSVTRNWRLTFRIDADEIEIVDLDFEDYH